MPGRLLHIYDGDFNWLMRTTAAGRSADHTVKVSGGVQGFISALDTLVAQNMRFSRAVIDSHGNEGMIFFKHEVIRASGWGRLANRGYEKLFPQRARIYFTGCNVAESEDGWKFLTEASKVFLRRGGGLAFAHDSKGVSLANPVYAAMGGLIFTLAFKGKMIHPPWDTVRGVYVDPGITSIRRVTLPTNPET